LSIPPKDSAAPALRALKASGITVKVLTGDSPDIARHVCQLVGLENAKRLSWGATSMTSAADPL
jgi:magnesium-transporting ATPase (P-type)